MTPSTSTMKSGLRILALVLGMSLLIMMASFSRLKKIDQDMLLDKSKGSSAKDTLSMERAFRTSGGMRGLFDEEISLRFIRLYYASSFEK